MDNYWFLLSIIHYPLLFTQSIIKGGLLYLARKSLTADKTIGR
jgi:hypothetical protein